MTTFAWQPWRINTVEIQLLIPVQTMNLHWCHAEMNPIWIKKSFVSIVTINSSPIEVSVQFLQRFIAGRQWSTCFKSVITGYPVKREGLMKSPQSYSILQLPLHEAYQLYHFIPNSLLQFSQQCLSCISTPDLLDHYEIGIGEYLHRKATESKHRSQIYVLQQTATE